MGQCNTQFFQVLYWQYHMFLQLPNCKVVCNYLSFCSLGHHSSVMLMISRSPNSISLHPMSAPPSTQRCPHSPSVVNLPASALPAPPSSLRHYPPCASALPHRYPFPCRLPWCHLPRCHRPPHVAALTMLSPSLLSISPNILGGHTPPSSSDLCPSLLLPILRCCLSYLSALPAPPSSLNLIEKLCSLCDTWHKWIWRRMFEPCIYLKFW